MKKVHILEPGCYTTALCSTYIEPNNSNVISPGAFEIEVKWRHATVDLGRPESLHNYYCQKCLAAYRKRKTGK